MNTDMTQGAAMKSMLRFAVPMILGNLLQQCYNVADTLIVGRFLGFNVLAVVGFCLAVSAVVCIFARPLMLLFVLP